MELWYKLYNPSLYLDNYLICYYFCLIFAPSIRTKMDGSDLIINII